MRSGITRMMKFLISAILASTIMTASAGENLTDADREALLEKLEKIRSDADSKVDARFRAAVSAYRAAMGSGDAARELYVKCFEKLNFTAQGKREADFREWKRKEADKLKDPAFGRALQHQLRWLVLLIRASSENARDEEVREEARAAMEAAFADAAELKSQLGLLSQGAAGSVFAKAYEISGLKTKKVPASPVNSAEIFENLLMPPLRSAEKLETLRSAWQRRIQLEQVKAAWAAPEKGTAFGSPAKSPEAEKFAKDVLPDLRWQMEKDLFSAGDERGAGLRMLEMIEANLADKSAVKWSEELRLLIMPKEEKTPGSAPLGETAEGAENPPPGNPDQ